MRKFTKKCLASRNNIYAVLSRVATKQRKCFFCHTLWFVGWLVGILGVLVGVLGVFVGLLGVLVGLLGALFGVLGVLVGVLSVLVGVLVVLVGAFLYRMAYLVSLALRWRTRDGAFGN